MMSEEEQRKIVLDGPEHWYSVLLAVSLLFVVPPLYYQYIGPVTTEVWTVIGVFLLVVKYGSEAIYCRWKWGDWTAPRYADARSEEG